MICCLYFYIDVVVIVVYDCCANELLLFISVADILRRTCTD